MAVALANKANNVSTSNGFSSGSISWTGGARGIVSISSAYAGGGSVSGHSVSGGGVTWNEIGSRDYASRRRVSMLVSDGTPSDGALTITANGSGTYQESQWSVDELTGYDATTVHDTAQTAVETGGAFKVVTLPDLGTIDAGDMAIFASGFEDAADNFAVQTGSTQHVKRSGGGNVRSFIVGTSTTDDTPGTQWDTVGSAAAIVGAIFNVGAAPAGQPTSKRHGGVPFMALPGRGNVWAPVMHQAMLIGPSLPIKRAA